MLLRKYKNIEPTAKKLVVLVPFHKDVIQSGNRIKAVKDKLRITWWETHTMSTYLDLSANV